MVESVLFENSLTKETNSPMVTEANIEMHEDWAGKPCRVFDSHGKKAYHPYTRIGFKFTTDQYGRVKVFENSKKVV